MAKSNKIHPYYLDSFMYNVNRANWQSPVKHSPHFGTVTHLKSALESKSGKREFSLSKVVDKRLRPGKYTFASLRKELSKITY